MLENRAPEQPYPGLQPFQSWEAAIFFGRDDHTDRLIEILGRERFLAVLGPSGSGKSSLVRAGLIPALPSSGLGQAGDWRFALVQPRDRPLRNLVRSLLGHTAFGQLAADAVWSPREALAEAELRRGPRGLVDLVRDLRQERGWPDGNLFLLVDQFEELFTYAGVGAAQEDEAEAFVNLLLATREDPTSGIYVALTMRTDFLGNCVRFLDLPDAINQSQYLTPRLTNDQLIEAIRGPAQVFGGKIEEALIGELVNSVKGNPDQLPVLQHALARMWELARDTDSRELTLQHWRDVGRTDEALGRHARDVLSALKPNEQSAAQWLFRGITEQRSVEAGGQLVRKPQSLEEIATWAGRDWKEFVPVLKAFGGAQVNFLSYRGRPDAPADGAATVVDLSHEALMRQWETLKGWIGAESRALERYRNLRDRAQAEAKKEGSLLTGADLIRALEWLDHGLNAESPVKPGESVAPTATWAARACSGGDDADRLKRARKEFEDVVDYIRRSDAKDKAQEKTARVARRVQTVMALAVFLFGIAAGIFGWKSYRTSRTLAAGSLWDPLMVNAAVSPMTDSEANALIGVARAPRPEREEFLKLGLQDTQRAARLAQRPSEILRAALGIDPAFRDRFLAECLRHHPGTNRESALPWSLAMIEVGGDLALDPLLTAIGQTTDVEAMAILGRGLGSLEAKSPATNAYERFRKYVWTLSRSDASEQWDLLKGVALACQKRVGAEKMAASIADVLQLQRSTAESWSSPREALGDLLAQMLSDTNAAPAKAMFEQVILVIRTAAEPLYGSDPVLSATIIESAASRLTSGEAAPMVPSLLEALQFAPTRARRASLTEALTQVVGRLNEQDAKGLIGTFMNAWTSARDEGSKTVASAGLGALHARLPREDADALAATLIEGLLGPGQAAEGAMSSESFCRLLGDSPAPTLLTNVSPPQLIAIFERVREYSRCRDQVGLVFMVQVQRMADQEVDGVFPQLSMMLTNLIDPAQLQALTGVYTNALLRMGPERAKELAPMLLRGIQSSSDQDQLEALGRSLAVALAGVNEAEAKDWLVRLKDLMLQPYEDDLYLSGRARNALGFPLRTVAARVSEEDANLLIPEIPLADVLTYRLSMDDFEPLLTGIEPALDRLTWDSLSHILASMTSDSSDWEGSLLLSNPAVLRIFDWLLVAAVERVPNDKTLYVAQEILESALARRPDSRGEYLANGLVAAFRRVDPAGAEVLWSRLLTSDLGMAYLVLSPRGGAVLSELARRLPNGPQGFTNHVDHLLVGARAGNRILDDIAPAMETLISRADSATLTNLVGVVAHAVITSPQTNWSALASPLGTLVARLTDADVDATLPALGVLGKATDWSSEPLCRQVLSGQQRAKAGPFVEHALVACAIVCATRDADTLALAKESFASMISTLSSDEAMDLLQFLQKSILSTTSPGQLAVLGSALGQAVRRVQDFGDDRLLTFLRSQFDAVQDPDQADAWNEGIWGVLSARDLMNGLTEVVIPGLTQLRADDYGQALSHSRALTNALPKLPVERVFEIAETLVQQTLAGSERHVLEAIQPALLASLHRVREDPSGRSVRSRILPMLIGALAQARSPGQMSVIQGTLLSLIAAMARDDLRAAVPELLARLQDNPGPEQLEGLSQALVAALVRWREWEGYATDTVQEAYGDSLRAVGQVMLPKGSTYHRLLNTVVESIHDAETRSESDEAGVAANTPSPRQSVGSTPTTARALIEMCRSPLVDRRKVAAIVRAGFPEAPGEAEGEWTFLRWAVAKFGVDPRLDLADTAAATAMAATGQSSR